MNETIHIPIDAPITIDALISSGWKAETLFFQIGNYEDEDDREIFVKDGMAVTWESTYKCYYRAHYSMLNYKDGFPLYDPVRYMCELNATL